MNAKTLIPKRFEDRQIGLPGWVVWDPESGRIIGELGNPIDWTPKGRSREVWLWARKSDAQESIRCLRNAEKRELEAKS